MICKSEMPMELADKFEGCQPNRAAYTQPSGSRKHKEGGCTAALAAALAAALDAAVPGTTALESGTTALEAGTEQRRVGSAGTAAVTQHIDTLPVAVDMPPVAEVGTPPVAEVGTPPVAEVGTPPGAEAGTPPGAEAGTPPEEEQRWGSWAARG
jgi:hypothetical protein